MVAAGVSWGVYSILGKGLGEPTAATGGNFMRAVPFAAALGLAAMNHSSIDLHGALYAALSGAITSGLGYALWYAALPAIAALGGVVLLSESLTTRLLIASAAILGGIAITTAGKRR